MNPENAVEGGGKLINDADVTIIGADYTDEWQYPNSDTFAFGFLLTMETDEPWGDDELTEHTQFYSAGQGDKFTITNKGRSLEPTSGATGLGKGCRANLFFTSLIEAGFPADKIENDTSLMLGTVMHVQRLPLPKGAFGGGKDDSGREKTYLACTQVISHPHQPNSPRTAKAIKKATKKSVKVDSGGNSDDPTKMVMGILSNAGGTLEIPAFYQLVFDALESNPNRNTVIKQMGASDNEFLSEGPWNYDAESNTIGLG